MRIAVIGGGAAGLTAAGSASGAQVVVFEHNEKLGKKIYITGKGRCNFTNACDVPVFLSNVVTNARFLRGALYRFTPDDAISLLEANGCPVKVERGRRAFPQSDKASDVTKALSRYASANGAQIRLNSSIKDIRRNADGGFNVVTADGDSENFDKVIICTGGVSYPSTGSDGSLHGIIRAFGHKITSLAPSLVGAYTQEDLSSAEGLTLKNVSISADGIKPIFGDLLITDKGVSGPIVLTLSALAAHRVKPYKIYLDLKPNIDADELDNRILRDFGEKTNRLLSNALDTLLPKSFIRFIIEKSGVPIKQINSVTRAERQKIRETIKKFELTVVGGEGFERAVVTSGGVDVSDVDPGTLGSKLVPGLYFAGEVLDVDALTGGYNMHIALATGFTAGRSAAEIK